jgi:hypothetical protein
VGLREDLEDVCVGMAGAILKAEALSLDEEVNTLLALKCRYSNEDPDIFANIFENTASTSFRSLPIISSVPSGLPPEIQPIYLCLLLELGLQKRFQERLGCRIELLRDSTFKTLSKMIEQRPHLFGRDLLVFLQEFGTRHAKSTSHQEHTQDGLKVESYCRHAIILAQSAALARRKAVLLRIALKDTPEIAEHGDEITTRLSALGADAALIETLRLAVVTVAPHSSEAILASSVGRSRAFLEEMLRFIRKLLESKGHVPPVTKELVTARAILDSLQAVLASQEAKLFQEFFNFISVSGVHSTSALLNQARLVRNTMIELTYYFLEKLRQECGIG